MAPVSTFITATRATSVPHPLRSWRWITSRCRETPPIETLRISKLSPGTYRFYVFNYSGEDPGGLSGSRATVQIFGASGQMGSFTVPGGTGFTWTVFSINGATGAVTGINQLATPPSGCQ